MRTPKHPVQEFNGVRFYLKPPGYYKADHAKHGVLYMHRFVWEHHNGPIPDGSHVHHINGNKADNRIENLALLNASDHYKHHLTERPANWWAESLESAREAAKKWHRSEAGRAWHSEHGKKAWEGRETLQYNCAHCSKAFFALRGALPRSGYGYCSNPCKSAARRASGVDNENRNCVVCCGSFTCNKYAKKTTCSKACATEAARQTKRLKA